MPVLHARIDTGRAARYLVQFCRHAAAMGDGRAHRFRGHGAAESVPRVTAQWDDATGQVVFDSWGRADLTAGPDALSIRLDAADDDTAGRLCRIIAADLHRFGGFTVEWVAAEPDSAAGEPA
ncbi:DUF2218 domain-containing protein [Nocardia sp. BMG111209]|uniref:DUF2218 domain-containing protein n=1 Tax=Nocardia sp. BMG111209 TaxID=1160137 RepID=UPI0012DCC6F0|nr:DUF2218 domain-containing protein [Nocardia sp. BMG111209]